MTTKRQLLKAQESIVTIFTKSIGFIAGEAVMIPTITANPGIVWSGGARQFRGVLQLDAGVDVRALGEDGAPETVALSADTATTSSFGVTLTPVSDSSKLKVYTRYARTEIDQIEFFPGGTSVLLTVQAALSGGIIRTVEILNSNSWRIRYSEDGPVFGGPLPAGATPRGGRVIARYATRQEASTNLLRIRNYRVTEPLDRTFARGWAFNPQSTLAQESYEDGGLYVDTQIEDGEYVLRLYGFANSAPAVLYPQLVGYTPARAELRTGKPDIPVTPTRIGASGVEYSVKFKRGSAVAETVTKSLANTNNLQTLEYTTDESGVDGVEITASQTYELNWIQHVDVPANPKPFTDPLSQNYEVIIPAPESESALTVPVVRLYGHSKAISVPSTASLAGTRPDQYLTYSGAWNGTSFQQLRTRCPIWTLFHVLTSADFGIRVPVAEVDTASFLSASIYCNQLLDGKPRWAFDGRLAGQQIEVVETLLSLVRGQLYWTPGSRKLAVYVERPVQARFMVCKANVRDGRIVYRNAAEARPPVRAVYTDRLTGQLEKVTSGPVDSRPIDISWQDPAVAERWAAWENFREQNLLDTVEFTLAWDPGHRVVPGDLVAVYDSSFAGIRNAGRVLESGTDWLQLDRPPWEFWPAEVAGARLLQQDGRVAIDQSRWGWVTTNAFRSSPILYLQKPTGGRTLALIDKVEWLPSGPDSANRVRLKAPVGPVEYGTIWASPNAGTEVLPTLWRVESISEQVDGHEFEIVASRYINGQHARVERNTPIFAEEHAFRPRTGSKLSLFQGQWDDLNERYPRPSSIPWGDEGGFDDLRTTG